MTASVAERLALLPAHDRAAIVRDLSDADADALLYDWRGFNARPDQVAPAGDWDIWLVLAGRGFGKTRTGAEWIREEVAAGRAGRIAIVAETAADARDVLVEGDSGILAVHPKADRPAYEPSKRRLTWPNGATATLFNATEPDQLRGPQFDAAWIDELAKYRYARETWDMLQFGLRLGQHPRQIVTTTPRPIELLKAIVAGSEGKVHITRGRTMDNRANLAASFMERITARYGGTRLGRQELDAEILGDLPGALWSLSQLDAYRLREAPAMGRILVAVDPAVTATETSDEHGIIVAGLAQGEPRGVVLEDASLSGSPRDWASRAVSLYRSYAADGIVVEVNQGGDMVAHTIRTIDPTAKVIEVRASRGKHVRAEPIAALYEQGRVAHVGSFPDLENQMTQMTLAGYEGTGSPDRLDALVWALTALFPAMVERPKPAPITITPRPALGAGRRI
jgi:phage terminase large subunit-like protein